MLYIGPLTRVFCILSACFAAAAASDLDVNLLRQNHDGPTNEGTLFAIAFLNNAVNVASLSSAIVYVLNKNPTTAVVEVSLPHNSAFPGYPQTVSIGPNSRREFTFSTVRNGVADIRVVNEQLRSLDKGIRVRSTNNVPVTVFGSNSEDKSTDTFLALPCQTVTTNIYKYFIFSSDRDGTQRSQFVVVACEDSTEVTFATSTRSGSVTLNGFQSYGISDNGDITGSIVTSNKPVAVFSGHQCGRIPVDKSACDHLVEQIPMHAVWGNTFFTAPFGYRGSGEIYRVGSLLPDNQINVTCSRRVGGSPATYATMRRTIGVRAYYQFKTITSPVGTPLTNYRRDFCCIEASKPAIVMQYMPGHSDDETNVPGIGSGIGDPSMSIIPPVGQYRSDFIGTTITASEVFTNMVTWTIPSQFFNPLSNADEVFVDGNVLSPVPRQGGSGRYIPIQCSNGEVCGYGAFTPLSGIGDVYKLQFNASRDPYAGINFNIYGYVPEMSYAHPAGFEMEPIGLPRIAVYNVTVKENVGTVTITFNRTGGDLSTNSRIFAETRSVSGQAVVGSDYTAVGRTRIRFRANEVLPVATDAPFVVTIRDDMVPESDEYFEVFFVIDVNGYPFPGVARVTIEDDDGGPSADVQFDPTTYAVTEGQSTLITLRLSSTVSSTVTATVTSSDMTAMADSDYVPISSQVVTFLPNQRTATFTAQTVANNINELSETFQVTITSASGASVGTNDKATVTINDDDDLTVQLNPSTVTVVEGESASIRAELNREADRPVSVTFNTADGTATAPADYTAVTSRTITFRNRATQQSVLVSTTTDTVTDNGEMFTATLSSPTAGLTLGTSRTSTVTILDAITVGFDPVTYNVQEGGTATLNVVLSRRATGPITVGFSTKEGTALAPSDYTSTTRTVTFPAGSTSQQVSVPIGNDQINELPETFTAELTNPSEEAVLGASMATVTITDNDDLSVQFVPDSYTVVEGQQVSFIAQLSRAADRSVSVIFNTVEGTATAPGDYTSVTSRAVTFSTGETEQTVPVSTTTDTVTDSGEMFTATLSNPTTGLTLGTAQRATVTILDSIVVGFVPATYTVTEGVQTMANLNVILSRASTVPITVAFETKAGTASAPSDYTSTTSTVTFPAGSTSQQVSVPINNDQVNELPETFTAELANPSGGAVLGASMATVNINDNDGLVFSINPAAISISEGNTDDLTVELNVAADRAVSVTVTSGGGTATAVTDYISILADVTFQPGDTDQIITVNTVQDTINEPDETFEVSLSNPTGGGSINSRDSSTVTIVDDDAPISVQFVPATYSTSEGTPANLVVMLSRDPAVTVEVMVVTVPGSATAGVDYTALTMTLTFRAGSSRATGPVSVLLDSINDPGESFTVELRNPSGAVLGAAPTATVNIIDANPVNVQFNPVTYSVNEGSSDDVIAVLNVPSTQSLTVDFDTMDGTATAASRDYTVVRRTLTFPAGTTRVPITVTATSDNTGEPDETFSAVLSNQSPGLTLGMQDTATITIAENDTPTVRFNPSVYNSIEGEQEMLLVVLSNPSSSEVTVRVMTADGSATAGQDYTAVSRVVTFSPGMTSVSVPVNVLEDNVNEEPEEFTATLSSPSGATLGMPFMAIITIVEDDDLVVNFNPTDYMPMEGGSAVLTATLNTPADREVTVQVRTVEGTATDPEDYTGGVRTLTFPAGVTSATTNIAIADDKLKERVERFTADLFNPQNGLTIGPSDTATVDITDNDVVMVMFTPNVYVVEEGSSVNVNVSLSLASTEPISVTVTSSSGTASDPADYVTVSRTLTFQPGETSVIFPVMTRQDQVDELQEQFSLSLSNPTNDAELGAADTATVRIDDTNTLLVNFVPDTYSVKEEESVTLTARLNTPADRDVTVVFSTVNGIASDATDYTAVTQTLTFLRSQTAAAVTVMTTVDDTQEGTERFTATLTNPTNGLAVGPAGTATVDIIDDDVVNVQFDPSTYTISENEGPANLTVILTKPSSDRVLVNIQTRSGTAEAPSDYTTVSQTLTFEPGTVSQVVQVPISDDNINEERESFVATLSNTQGASLGPSSTATVNIEDNDPLVVEFRPTEYTGMEGESVTLTAVLNRPADREITVVLMTQDDSAQAPADYTSANVVLTFPAGSQTAIASVPVIADGVNERAESFTAILSNPSGGATLGSDRTATVTIPSPDPLTVNFNPSTYTVLEGDSRLLTLELDSPADREVSVDVTLVSGTATAGSDYMAETVTVTFPVGQTRRTTTVTTLEDSVSEGREVFTATLRNPVGDNFSIGPTNTATVNINDDDVLSVNFNPTTYTVTEGESTGVFVVLSNPSTTPITVEVVTVAGTADASDFMPFSMTISFLAGETTKTVTVTSTEDIADERDEIFSVILRNPSGAALGPDSRADVTIVDDDVVVVEFDPTSYTVTEGNNAVVTIVTDRVPASQVAVTLETIDGSATSPSDFSSISTVVTIPSGRTSITVTVPIETDTIAELTEFFNAILINPSPNARLGPRNTSTIQIDDNDVVIITLVEREYTVVEDEGMVEVCIRLSRAADRDIYVTGILMPVQAQEGTDYVGRSVQFNVSAGNTEACDDIVIEDDKIVESEEKFRVILEPPTSPLNVIIGFRSSANVTIIDDDSFTADIKQPTYRVRENETSLEVCATLSNPSSEDIVVTATTQPISAQAGEDFVNETITFTFRAGEQEACSRVTIVDNKVREPTEQFRIVINPPSASGGPAPGPRSTSTVTIDDDDDLVVNFENEIYRVRENEGPVEVCAVLNNPASEDITVNAVARESDTPDAQAGEDFVAGSVPITFRAGQTEACGNIIIVNDGVREKLIEKFTVDLEVPPQPLSPMLGTESSVPVEIEDDDSVTIKFVDDNPIVKENNGTVTICIEKSGVSDEDIMITVRAEESSPPDARAGRDFGANNFSLTIRSSDSVACISVPIIDNNIAMEPNKTFILIVDPPRGVNPPIRGRVTIQDDDIVRVSWETPETVTPEDAGTRMVCFRTDKESFSPYMVTVTSEGTTSNPATFGVDYSTASQNIVVDIPAGPADRYCVDVTILDDTVAMEGNETFTLRFNNLPPGVTTGQVPESSVVIVDDDVVAVEFRTPDMTVSESIGNATICVVRNATTEENMIVTVTTNFGSATNSDFEEETVDVVFTPLQTLSCIEVPIKNDQNPEPREFFTLRFVRRPGQTFVTPSSGNETIVTIIDDDFPGTGACVIEDTLRVSPFNAKPSYQFRGTCELTALQSCNGSRPDFSVRVDYLSDTFDIGAVGILKDGFIWTIGEDEDVQTTSTEVARVSGSTTTYARSEITIVKDVGAVSIRVGDGIGVTVTRSFAADGSIMINASSGSSLLETCGICGTQQGQLLSLDGRVTPMDATMEQKQAFVSGFRVPANDQLLRPVRPECAVIRNDTVIGDPLYTVPFGTGNLNLCFEIHGAPDTTYNLISDTCVNVNAHYAKAGPLNIIDSIAIKAEGNSETCRDVRVDLDNCTASASPMGGGIMVPLTGMLVENGISVKLYPDRVRIAVPNCQNLRLVMWVICEPAANEMPSSIRFHVSRGINLKPTSHGLLGQFWNIPIAVTQLSSSTYNVSVEPMNGAAKRYFQGDYFQRTWDNRKEPCIYVGNGQGGRSGENPRIDDSVIQGRYNDYSMNDLFGTTYKYSEWESDCTA